MRVEDIEAREVMPGFRGRFIHSERTTHVYWEIEPDRPLPEHSHPHEQIVNMLEGDVRAGGRWNTTRPECG